ncbi:MAG TPA: MFS transporter [Candidatus Dormibacteraeota bacterium]|nr:MFS transporter [Candidatus Dormibacteraeota bacterium]
MSADIAQSPAAVVGPRPTNVRWVIVAMTGLTTAVAMMGRLDLGVLGKSIQDEFAFNTQTMGWIFSAFVFAYHPFQIPGGWAGDRFGPRKIFTFAILLWAVATAAMGVVARFSLTEWIGLAWSFAILRFLVGMGEAPMSPNAARVVASWMDRKRRGIGVSFHMIGIGLGGALSPLLITWIAQRWGWRPSFYLAGACGTIVALLWWFYSTDRPEDHPRVNAAELSLIRSGRADHDAGEETGFGTQQRTPWVKIFSSLSVWGILLSYFCQGYMPTIYSTWFFIYLERVRGLTLLQGGLWGSLPFLTIMVLAPLGGLLSDYWVAKLGKRRGRRMTVWLGMGGSALLIWAGVHTANNTIAMLMLGAAAGLNYFALPSWWATCIDLTPEHSGALSGLMNMSSGGWLSPILTAYIVIHFGWTPALDVAALVTAMGALLWFFVDASKTLEKPSAETAAG